MEDFIVPDGQVRSDDEDFHEEGNTREPEGSEDSDSDTGELNSNESSEEVAPEEGDARESTTMVYDEFGNPVRKSGRLEEKRKEEEKERKRERRRQRKARKEAEKARKEQERRAKKRKRRPKSIYCESDDSEEEESEEESEEVETVARPKRRRTNSGTSRSATPAQPPATRVVYRDRYIAAPTVYVPQPIYIPTPMATPIPTPTVTSTTSRLKPVLFEVEVHFPFAGLKTSSHN